ncbi:hypothetical protein VMCG_06642 [Cytospora schulzeri]|uniref:non-specific serine/threonine protein kinase n=1 Tax=Cytospora schulzeri TaxID=448051 RepID=A0A423W6Z2_9PEZI|nr:hypothetical protein VMCG_06642 [Valsa malicola]
MASYGHPAPVAAPRHGQAAAYGAPIPVMPGPGAPAGTFAPGTKIQVGSHRVVIQKYLSEGGFAHVYLVKMPTPVDGTDLAVLKRVAVPDKDALRGMRTEVETMKRLKGHRPIVTYIDSHASELKGGGYEVFLLMEYCNGGGLIDFMNTRLQHRLTEPEILQIFTDVAEGVACMHYLKPPLLHRDLKVENVLFITTGSKRKFKLCDFGSAASPRPAPTTVVECRLVDEDVQKHTTMQYRSPEMVDVYRKQPIDEKSDIWALGVLLYKLCYYTTPFEEQGQLAILNASYRFPSYPAFSDRLKKLIASMLKETPQARPNIYQVLKESCAMQGRDVPVKDIYIGTSQSESHATRQDASKSSTPVVGAVFSPPPQQETVIPDIAPMRRGRLPVSSGQPATQSTKLSPSPMRINNGDPFAALDSSAALKGADELSNKFPTLDQFSILHEKGVKFDFEGTDISMAGPQTVTPKLADEAFAPVSNRQPAEVGRGAQMPSTSPERQAAQPSVKSASAPPRPAEMSRASSIIKNTPELQAISSGSAQAFQASPTRPNMVSTGTMTTPPPERQLAATPLGKKSIFAGKFGDAFKRFESSQPGGAPEARTPSPFRALDRNELTPIAGSEATDGRSDDGQALGDVDEITPEMRREIEQRQLEEEEKRVAAAQAEYRARVAQRGEGGKPTPPPVSGSSRAISIQSKVQSLLDENARSATNVKRTAEGYGQYTEPAAGSAQSVDSRPEPALDMTAQEKDDYLRDFSKRFPSLTSIEMVERDLAAEENTRPGR